VSTCVACRASEAPSIRNPLVSLTHVGFEEAAHEFHLAGVSLPTVQTVFRLALVRTGTCVVRCASQGRCWGNKYVTRIEAIFEREQLRDSELLDALPRCYQDLSLRAPPTHHIEGFCGTLICWEANTENNGMLTFGSDSTCGFTYSEKSQVAITLIY
jgi:hypothetical protein